MYIAPALHLEMPPQFHFIWEVVILYEISNSHRIDKLYAITKVKIHDNSILQGLWAITTKTFGGAIQKESQHSYHLVNHEKHQANHWSLGTKIMFKFLVPKATLLPLVIERSMLVIG